MREFPFNDDAFAYVRQGRIIRENYLRVEGEKDVRLYLKMLYPDPTTISEGSLVTHKNEVLFTSIKPGRKNPTDGWVLDLCTSDGRRNRVDKDWTIGRGWSLWTLDGPTDSFITFYELWVHVVPTYTTVMCRTVR